MTVLVVGSGPAACATALALRRRGRPVTMVGAAARHATGTLEVLSGEALAALEDLGAEAALLGAIPLGARRTRWGTRAFVDTPSILTPGSPGWIVDRREFDDRLRSVAAARGVEWHQSRVRVADLTAQSEVVIATGRATGRPVVAERSYDSQVAITAFVPGPALGHLEGVLLVDSALDGWWYAIGSRAGTSIGYVTDLQGLVGGPDRVRSTWRAALETVDFVRQGVLDDLDLVTRVSTGRPAASSTGCSVLVGDAALALDPLSGGGLRFALESGVSAAEPIVDGDIERYRGWLGETAAAHRSHAASTYAAGRFASAPYWRRRQTELDLAA